jgi:small subunit ribosomal protein S9
MADDDTQTPDEATPAEHAVPSEDATEIAGSAEDAALEALQESKEDPPAESAESEPFEPIAGNAVPTEDATEIAGSTEDAALEAAQERAEEAVGEAVAEEIAEEVLVEAVVEEIVEEAVAQEIAEEAEAELEEDEEENAPRVKPAVPGAHLEVDIVPEGVDPLGRSEARGEAYADPYAVEGEGSESETDAQGDEQETLTEPISTAAIDLASGARYRATGKRKTAVARVTLRPGSGSYLVNGKTLEEHFPRITQQRNIRQPLETVGYQERMDVVARLHGGGISAQAGALRHGVSRALLEADPNLRGELKRRGFLTRDSRAKERKKAGLKKARKKPQFSKR